MDNENGEVYITPVNIDDNGDLAGGRIKLKNLIEAIICTAVLLFLWKIISIAFGLVGKVILLLPIVIVALIIVAGVNGESFGEYLIEVIIFNKKKKKIKYCIPQKQEEKKKKKHKAEKKKENAKSKKKKRKGDNPEEEN